MLESLAAFWNQIVGVFSSFGLRDLFDISIVAFLIYKGIQMVRETRAVQLIKGVLLLVAAFFVSQQIGLNTITELLKMVFDVSIIAIIILFQPELRRALEQFGTSRVGIFKMFGSSEPKDIDLLESAIAKTASAAEILSRSKTGALIVFERKVKLGEQVATGVEVNADVSVELLSNIFFKNSPLHDGAVVIRDGKLLAASCFLPKPLKEDKIDRSLGARHRAAIGMSENSDAIVLVVSEETGKLSIALNGELTTGYNKITLLEFLKQQIIPEPKDEKKKTDFFKKH